MPKDLTTRQKLWAQHYATNKGNALQAARDAGYSPKGLERMSGANAKNVQIMAYLKTLTTEQVDSQASRIADARERAEFLTAMMRGEIKAPYVTRDGMQNDQPAHEARIKAAMELAKIQGDYAPVKHVVKNRISFEDFISDDPLEEAASDDET